MSLLSREELVGQLTKGELEAVLPEGIFSQRLDRIPWDAIISTLQAQSDHVLKLVSEANERKVREVREKMLEHRRLYMANWRRRMWEKHQKEDMENMKDKMDEDKGYG